MGKLLNGKLKDLYSLPKVILVMKKRRKKWTWH